MAVEIEFVALGMAAEVVVIVENEDAARAAGVLAIKMRGGKTADARADHDEIVLFAGIDGGGRCLSIAQGVGGFERSGMTAAHAGEERGIVARRILGGGRDRSGRTRRRGGLVAKAVGEQWRPLVPPFRCDSVQEVAPGDRPIHPERASPIGRSFFSMIS